MFPEPFRIIRPRVLDFGVVTKVNAEEIHGPGHTRGAAPMHPQDTDGGGFVVSVGHNVRVKAATAD